MLFDKDGIQLSSDHDYTGDVYVEILKFFLGKANCFELVIRTDIDFKGDETFSYHSSAYDLISELAPFITEEKSSEKWFASETLDTPAKIYTGSYNQQSLAIILKHTQKFSDWQGPDMPEDLSLLHDNKALFSIIGHEAMGFWKLGHEDYLLLKEQSDVMEHMNDY